MKMAIVLKGSSEDRVICRLIFFSVAEERRKEKYMLVCVDQGRDYTVE